MLEGTNKEGLDFIDSLFDQLDTEGVESLGRECCEGLLDKLRIKVGRMG